LRGRAQKKERSGSDDNDDRDCFNKFHIRQVLYRPNAVRVEKNPGSLGCARDDTRSGHESIAEMQAT
jgi:hypothetical protein